MISPVRFFNVRAIARHKGQRVGNHYVLADTHLTQLHAFSYLPDTTRMKATRSRCFGSMLA